MKIYQLTQEEQKLFLDAIQAFKSRIDSQWDNGNGNKNKTSWADLRDSLVPITEKLNLTLICSTGSGKLPYAEDEFCSMCFFRKDLNPQIYPAEVQFGFYVWLGYYFKTLEFELRFGRGGKYNPLIDQTKGIKELENKKLQYYYKNYDELAKSFSSDFLSLVEALNSQNILDFEIPNLINTISEKTLGLELKIAYDSAELKEKVNSILMFGIVKHSIISDHKLSPDKIIKESGLGDSYATELRKGMKIGKKLLDMQLLNTNLSIQQSKNELAISTPLNQILYGSPGTGKTYSTIDKALEILGVDVESKNRQELKTLFEDYKSKGQIEFVTFHQNYGYEEFVEGIKPKLDENGGENKSLEYKIEEGIFKIICERARQNTKDFLEKIHQNYNSDEPIDFKRDLWRLYTLPNGDIEDDYFKDCIDKNYIYANKNFGKEKLISPDVQKGDYIIIPSAIPGKRSKSIRAFGVFGDVIKEKIDEEKGYRSVEWYWFTENQDEELFFENVNFAQQTFSKVKKSKNVILDYFNTKSENIIDDISKPHILIIDEINRGNISKIFGELITLIEPSKRIGEEEELRVTLPYSQDSFGVPNNLYIIGTMNTADRSITSLDTAIRRRFEFVEMMPDATKLEGKVIEGINLQKMLTAINERIEFLYDREKTIGHAYLLDIKNLDDLKEAFQNKIIPLLQEYFYRNYTLIQAVLNDNGMIKEVEDSKKTSIINCKGFKKLENIDFESKTIYSISDDENLWDDPQTYINIYEG